MANTGIASRPGISAVNRGRRALGYIQNALSAEQIVQSCERRGDIEVAATYRGIADVWTNAAASEARWAFHYAGRALDRR